MERRIELENLDEQKKLIEDILKRITKVNEVMLSPEIEEYTTESGLKYNVIKGYEVTIKLIMGRE